MANPTACLLVIGNEVLSGRTQDANIRFLATRLGEIGIPLREVRVIPDEGEEYTFTARCRIDTYNELEYFKAGGILHYVLRRLAA